MYFDPRHAFAHFYGNPTMAGPDIGGRPIWTVSDNDKRPIHMGVLLDQGRVVGARPDDVDARLTLDELAHRLPTAANACALWDHGLTGHVIVDIESDCSVETRNRLLGGLLPHAVYAEVSRSGLGYHLVIPTPTNLRDFPHAMYKRKLQAADRSVEILLHHWCTFTRTPIPGDVVDAARAFAAAAPHAVCPNIESLYALLATHANTAAHGEAVSDDYHALLPPRDEATAAAEDAIIASVVADHLSTYTKTAADFNHDHSRFEFSQLASLARAISLQHLLHTHTTDAAPLTPDRLAGMTYRAGVAVIAHRPKHDGQRLGLPYLLYQAAAVVRTIDLGVGAAPATTGATPNPLSTAPQEKR